MAGAFVRGAPLWLLLLGAVCGIGIGSATASAPLMGLAAAASVFMLLASFWMMQAAVRVRTISHPTIPGIWYLTYLVTMYVPSILIVFFKLSPSGYPYRIEEGPHLGTLWFGINTALVTVPLGVCIASRLLRFKPGEVGRYFAADLVEERDPVPRMLAFAALAAAAFALSAAYLWDVVTKVGALPLFELFQIHGRALAQLRIGASVALNSPLRYLYAILLGTLYPFLSACTFGYFLHTRTTYWAALFLGTFVVGALSAAMSTARSGVAIILLVLFAFVYMYRRGKLGKPLFIVSLPLVLLFPIIVTVAMYRIGFVSALRAIGVRLFYTSAYVQYLYFELVPSRIDFLSGRTSTIFAALTGQPYFNLQEYVARLPYPNAPAHVMTNGPFIGDFYANFGIIGIVLGGVVAGVIMGWLQIWLVRRPKTVVNLVVYALLLYVFSTLSDHPLPVVLWSGGVFFIFLALWVAAALTALLNVGVAAPKPET